MATLQTIFLIQSQIKQIYWCICRKFPLRLIFCDICFKEIPESTLFPHPVGIVIKTGTLIGNNCCIRQNVTIGDRNFYRGEPNAQIGDNCNIGAGVIILGAIKIGSNVDIGAGTIVLENVPDNTTVVNNRGVIHKNKKDETYYHIM